MSHLKSLFIVSTKTNMQTFFNNSTHILFSASIPVLLLYLVVCEQTKIADETAVLPPLSSLLGSVPASMRPWVVCSC